MLTIEQYADIHGLAKSKVKKMCPYITNAEQCVCCQKWIIPKDAVPVYIPDKRLYTKITRKYCYVLDAINDNQLIVEEITYISENECRALVRELEENGLIKAIVEDNNYDYQNYIVSIRGVEWRQKDSKEKSKIIEDFLKAMLGTVKIVLP